MTWRVLLAGVLDLLRRPWHLAAAVAGVAVAVFLCGLLALAALAVDGAFARGQGQIQFQVYWKPGADPALVSRQMDWMRALPGVVEARSFTPEQALAVMRHSLGKQADEALAPAGRNPLPYTLLLGLRMPVDDPAYARDMYERLAGVEGVGEVRYNPVAVDMAQALGAAGRRVALPLGAFVAILVGLVVGNTVRLSLLRRREELEILRLVGATRWYVRLPMVCGAGLIGLCGSSLAFVGLKIVQMLVANALDAPPLWLPLPFLPAGLVVVTIVWTTIVAALAGLFAAEESHV